MKNEVRKSYLLTLIIVLLPILSIYKSPIQGLDLGSLLLISVFVLTVYRSKRVYLNFPREWAVYLLIVLLSVFLIYPFSIKNQSIDYVFLRTSKYVLYMVIGIYSASNGIFHFSFGLLVYKSVGLVSVFMILFQSFLFRYFGINLIGVLPNLLFLKSYTDRFLNFTTQNRPTSFFLEPGHFFDYIMLLLIMLLFRKTNQRIIDIIFAIFVSIGLVLSTSGQAILFVIFIWIYFFFTVFKRRTISNILKAISLILIIAVLLSQYSVIYFFQNNLERILNLSAVGGNAVVARSEGFRAFFALPFLNKLVGVGYANTPNYFFSSMSFNLYTLGIVSIFFILNIYNKLYNDSSELYIKLLVVTMLIVSFGNTIFMSVSSVFYFSFIYTSLLHSGSRQN